ncbi:TadE/TadG family type IV pilus assembly protein [Dongia deserti]|uniref:TadE/TadG family type IV pilus assembly protein n=1 Tax=Dongia deserti TaxID=2268030 RepID=UPI0013C52B7B|nr:TadE/TadG family type IV pilus assembly protein [Dongia deserti]
MRKLTFAFERLCKRFLVNEDGLVAIEFGLVASLLTLMLIGATDLGLAARHRSQMESAVRAGIQAALKGGSEEAVKAAIDASTDLPSDPPATVSASKVCYDKDGAELSDCDSGGVADIYMEISLEQDHKWLLGLPGFSNPSKLKLNNSIKILSVAAS